MSENATAVVEIMRKLWIVGAVASSLVLAACGVSASIDQAVSSIGASPYLQVHLTASATGMGSTQAQSLLGALSVDMHYASSNGGTLSQSANSVNSEVMINDSGQTLLDLRQVDKNLYVRVDLTPLSSIPGIDISAQQLSNYQLLVGNRWFEFSPDLVKSFLPTTTINAAQTSKEQAAARAILDAVTSLIDKTPYTTLSGGGYSQTGTLDSVVKAVLPALNGYTGTSFNPSSVKGTYTIGFTMSGATATGGSLSITAPKGSNGNATLSLHASLTHDNLSVVAPSDATVITNSTLTQLLSQVQGTASPLG